MLRLLFAASTLCLRAPIHRGKVCAQHVGDVWVVAGENLCVSHTHSTGSSRVRKSPLLILGLYTFCVQFYTACVGKITSVVYGLYTLYTGPTIKTITYI